MLPALGDAFRTGEGIAWHDRDPGLFDAEERFSRPFHHTCWPRPGSPGCPAWSTPRRRGAVADVGCGSERARSPWPDAPPQSSVHRLRLPRPLDRQSTRRGRGAGVADRVSFEVADARTSQATATTSCCSSTRCVAGDPVAATRHARTLMSGGRLVTLTPKRGATGWPRTSPTRSPRCLSRLDDHLHRRRDRPTRPDRPRRPRGRTRTAPSLGLASVRCQPMAQRSLILETATNNLYRRSRPTDEDPPVVVDAGLGWNFSHRTSAACGLRSTFRSSGSPITRSKENHEACGWIGRRKPAKLKTDDNVPGRREGIGGVGRIRAVPGHPSLGSVPPAGASRVAPRKKRSPGRAA